jgi:hypothetical protein
LPNTSKAIKALSEQDLVIELSSEGLLIFGTVKDFNDQILLVSALSCGVKVGPLSVFLQAAKSVPATIKDRINFLFFIKVFI